MVKAEKVTLLNDYHLLSYDVLDSTNAEAKRLAAAGGSHGAVIWAKSQTAGRGRMGREWVSAPGNLYVTILLHQTGAMELSPQLSFVASLAVAETLAAIVPDPAAITCKWPNDVLAGGKKIAGILLEAFSTKEMRGDSHWLAVGVGINVDNFPEHVLFPATCLRDAGVEIISAKIVLSRFIHNFILRHDTWLKDGFAPIKRDWLSRAHHLDKQVEVIMGEDKLSGIFLGVDAQGQMLLRNKKKEMLTVNAGDVFF